MSLSNLLARDAALATTGEELGIFKAYSPELPIADITGTRIVKCLYRNKPGATDTKQNAFVRVPNKHLTESAIVANIKELAPYVLAWLESEEDKLIKASHSSGLLSIYTDKLTLANLLAHLEETTEGARLTKEKLAAWFDEYMAENLALLVMDKLGLVEIDESAEAKILMIVEAYKRKLTMLASPKTVLADNDRESLINALDKAIAEDSPAYLLASRLRTRLENMTQKTDDLLLEL